MEDTLRIKYFTKQNVDHKASWFVRLLSSMRKLAHREKDRTMDDVERLLPERWIGLTVTPNQAEYLNR